MTNDLSPAGVDAWITRLYDTGPSNDRVSIHLEDLLFFLTQV